MDNVGVIGGEDNDATPVRISSSGSVFWQPPTEVTSSCIMNIAQFPFDRQTCEVILLGFSYPLSEVAITAG